MLVPQRIVVKTTRSSDRPQSSIFSVIVNRFTWKEYWIETIHILYGWHTEGCWNINYNIPSAWLLNRSPVPAMDLKSNRSGLWHHMLETCRRLRDYVANVQTMSCDIIKLQLNQHFCRATWVSCRVGVTLCCGFYTFRSCNTCTFSLTTFAVLRHTT